MFHTTLLGYDRLEVDDHLRQAELAHARLADERDAAGARCRELERRLNAAHHENTGLRERIALLRRQPIDAAALQERLRGMLDVAREEAAEYLTAARAQAARELETARREVAELQRLRDRLRDQLHQASELLEADLRTDPPAPPRLVAA
ncbi:DivIVA domain-containing protein [Amycolatopsis magusensis]|uniref:DivIVA domain-containing protein n=1 Tax=Amycolatopsis magusensis TaxID=882444 RepID=UPI0037BB6215